MLLAAVCDLMLLNEPIDRTEVAPFLSAAFRFYVSGS